jgi:hypothetical protein
MYIQNLPFFYKNLRSLFKQLSSSVTNNLNCFQKFILRMLVNTKPTENIGLKGSYNTQKDYARHLERMCSLFLRDRSTFLLDNEFVRDNE